MSKEVERLQGLTSQMQIQCLHIVSNACAQRLWMRIHLNCSQKANIYAELSKVTATAFGDWNGQSHKYWNTPAKFELVSIALYHFGFRTLPPLVLDNFIVAFLVCVNNGLSWLLKRTYHLLMSAQESVAKNVHSFAIQFLEILHCLELDFHILKHCSISICECEL